MRVEVSVEVCAGEEGGRVGGARVCRVAQGEGEEGAGQGRRRTAEAEGGGHGGGGGYLRKGLVRWERERRRGERGAVVSED